MVNNSKALPFYAFAAAILLQVFTAFPVQAQSGTLSARVDREQISIDETLNLTIRYTGKTSAQPDFSELTGDFNVRNQGSSSQTSIINGQVESTTEWQLLLEPKREGKLQIPSFQVESAHSKSIEIDVTPPQPVPTGKLHDIFLETLIEKSSAYVQEQIKVTYRLYFSVGVDSLDVDPFNLSDVVIEPLPETIYQRRVSGQNYRVAEYSYAFFPQNSGQLDIPALNWRVGVQVASNQRDFFGRPITRTQVKRLRSEGKTIEIKPKPASFPADAVWLPANDLKLSETWSSEEFKVGEPVTRNLTTIAEGLRVEQLPIFLSEENLNGQVSDNRIKFYADQPQTVDDKNAQGFVAKRVESAAVVINAPGKVTIPAIRIPWWDVDEDKLRYAQIPARVVETVGTAASTTSREPATGSLPSETPSSTNATPAASEETLQKLASLESRLLITQILFALTLISTLVFAGLYFYQRRNGSTPQTASTKENTTSKKILKACESSTPQELRKLLLNWAQKHWPRENVTTLEDIARISNSQRLRQELLKLDAAIYRDQSTESWDGKELADAMKEAIDFEKQAARVKSDLASLY